MYKYARYFARRHPRVIEDDKAVEVVVRLEEDAYAAAAGGLGRSLTVRKVAEIPVSETARTSISDESDATRVAPRIGVNLHDGNTPYHEPYYSQEDLYGADSGRSTPARGLMGGISAVDFAAQSRDQSREQSRDNSRTRHGQRDNDRLHYAASMASIGSSNYSNAFNDPSNIVKESRWV